MQISLPPVRSQFAVEKFKAMYNRVNSNLTKDATQSDVAKRADYFAIKAINDSKILTIEAFNTEDI